MGELISLNDLQGISCKVVDNHSWNADGIIYAYTYIYIPNIHPYIRVTSLNIYNCFEN